MTDTDKIMNPEHFGKDPADIRIWINPAIRIRITDQFWLKFWHWQRSALSEPSLVDSCITRVTTSQFFCRKVLVAAVYICFFRITGRRKAGRSVVEVRLTCLMNIERTCHRYKPFLTSSGPSHCLPLRLMCCIPTRHRCHSPCSIDIPAPATGQCRMKWECGPVCRCSSIWWTDTSLNMVPVCITVISLTYHNKTFWYDTVHTCAVDCSVRI